MQSISEYTIIGAGVAGLATAIGLQQLGRDFVLFEQAPIIKGIGAGFGLAANAMQALTYLGMKDKVAALGHHLDSYQILDDRGDILVAPHTSKLSMKYAQGNFAIHRADLHRCLIAEVAPSQLLLGKRANHFVQHADGIVIYFEDGSLHKTQYLLIADGVKSPLRQQLLPESSPRYAGYTCWRATINNSDIRLSIGSETWGQAGRFGMTPLVNNRIYWYACINSTANNQTLGRYKVADLLNHFGRYHSPIPMILEQTKDEDLIWSDIMDIKPLKNFAYGNILLLGDAAHATTPNLGQGACQALEDVAVLMDELAACNDVAQSFKQFEKRRLSRTKYITDTSRSIGQVAQWQHPLAIGLRNKLLKITPNYFKQFTLQKLLAVDFMTLNKN